MSRLVVVVSLLVSVVSVSSAATRETDEALLARYRAAHGAYAGAVSAHVGRVKAWDELGITDQPQSLLTSLGGSMQSRGTIWPLFAIMSDAWRQRTNKLLASMPTEVTGGYQIPRAVSQDHAAHLRHEDKATGQTRGFSSGTRAFEDEFTRGVVEHIGDRDLATEVVAELQKIDRRLRSTARLDAAADDIDDLEVELTKRFERRWGATRRDLAAFLPTAGEQALVQLALDTRRELERMLASPRLRSQRVAEGRASRTVSRDLRAVDDGRQLEVGVSLSPLRFDVGAARRTQTVTASTHERSESSWHTDALVPGADQYAVAVRAPVRVGADVGEADARDLDGLLADDDALTRFEARQVIEHAVALQEIVDQLERVKGGKLPGELRKWMKTRLSFAGPARTMTGGPLRGPWGSVELRFADREASRVSDAARTLGHRPLVGARPGRASAVGRPAFGGLAGLPRAR